ncbi:MAG: LptF/LptG family permease [Bacteroidetes bacterium]|nr:LptF/LptG family permease [Bacteroidota bacterium]
MFTKLDKLILRSFAGPFIATFFITLLVLVMQFFWLYIDDFVGKGLGPGVILEFIGYQSAVLVPLALPLAMLLSSLMTFGNMGENFELVAIKSAGISLLRFMRPLFLLSILVSFIAFLFSNYVIPVANLKSRTLLADIVYAKPAFDLREGVFYDRIGGYAIKIGQKESNDSVIRDVIIYEQGNLLQDNFVMAKSGVMRVTGNKRFLEMHLRDGWRYQERGNPFDAGNNEYIRTGFKTYTKQFDLGTLGFTNRTADSVNKNNERMFSMRQLNRAIDSLQRERDTVVRRMTRDWLSQFTFNEMMDTTWSAQPLSAAEKKLLKGKKNFNQLLPDSARAVLLSTTQSAAASIRMNAESLQSVLSDKSRSVRRHFIEWHRKLALSVACIILFLIGAPLGAIIRKGGLGTPLIFAIIFFMLFYFSSTIGEKFAKEDSLTPFMGMWLATFVLLPLGLFLTYKAMNDSKLLTKETYSKWAATFVGIPKWLTRKKNIS